MIFIFLVFLSEEICQLRQITSTASTPPDSDTGILRHISPCIAHSEPESRGKLGKINGRLLQTKDLFTFAFSLFITFIIVTPSSHQHWFSITSNYQLNILVHYCWFSLKLNDINLTECYNNMKIGNLSLKIKLCIEFYTTPYFPVITFQYKTCE